MVLSAKRIPQKTVCAEVELGWDSDIPALDTQEWTCWLKVLYQLEDLTMNFTEMTDALSHHFEDASDSSYSD